MTIGGLLIAIETILTYVFTYQLVHVYEKLIRIAIIASLAMFGKPCIFGYIMFAAILCFSIMFLLWFIQY